MDREIVEQKLESLRRCIRRIRDKCPLDVDTLANDADSQDIVALNLTRAVQISVDIGAHLIAAMEIQPPDTMGTTFDLLAQQGVVSTELAKNLKKAVGFRNIAVHSYEQINWHIVHSIIRNNLADFAGFAEAVSRRL